MRFTRNASAKQFIMHAIQAGRQPLRFATSISGFAGLGAAKSCRDILPSLPFHGKASVERDGGS